MKVVITYLILSMICVAFSSVRQPNPDHTQRDNKHPPSVAYKMQCVPSSEE